MKTRRRQNHVAGTAFPLIVVGVLCLSVCAGDEPEGSPIVNYVSPSLLETNDVAAVLHLNGAADQDVNDVWTEWHLGRPRRKLTAGERWVKFEAEFGIAENHSTGIKGSMETAKYNLDKATFAVNEFIIYVEQAINFEYELRNFRPATTTPRPRRYYTSPFQDALDNVRLKSDFNLDIPSGKPNLGMRLVLPIGD